MLWCSPTRIMIHQPFRNLAAHTPSRTMRWELRSSDTHSIISKTGRIGKHGKILLPLPRPSSAPSNSGMDNISSFNVRVSTLSLSHTTLTIFVSDWSSFVSSSTHVVHADIGTSKQRRVPQYIARGPFNTWGFDKGINSIMEARDDGTWELEVRIISSFERAAF